MDGLNASSLSSRDLFSGERGSAEESGVGIMFQQQSTGAVAVKTIVPGGAAEREGSVHVGDIIVRVDSQSVFNEPLPTLRSLILGPQGTPITLTFRRGNSLYDVRLIRGSADYHSQLQSHRAIRLPMGDLDDDVDALRLKLRQALALGASDREELDKIRKMLQMERDLAARRDVEIKATQTAHHDDILRLQEAIRRAEQARRETEIKLNPLQQRDAELSEELSRQRDKERLRKEYIEELKRRFEEEKVVLETTLASEQNQRRDDLIARHQAESMLQKVSAEITRMRHIEDQRRQRELAYREKYEMEQSRLLEVAQHEERMRSCLRDVDLQLSSWSSEYFGEMPYSPDEVDIEPTEAFIMT